MASNGEPLENLLNKGWDYHDKESERLASELEAAAARGVTTNELAPFLHLSNHTIGEHLGDWTRAFVLGRHVLGGEQPTSETARAWGRLYVAAVLAGEPIAAAESELSYLRSAGDDATAALLDMRFMLAAALVGAKRIDDAARIYRGALDLIGQIPQSVALNRAIAVASNNLGWELYETPSRTTDDNALMRLCAETSLAFWRKCGDWINEEQALYLKALVSNAMGDPRSSLENADKGLAIISMNGKRPLDAARLHLVRATSLGAMGDAAGELRAIADADIAASALTAPHLKMQFDAERAKIVAPAPPPNAI